MPRSKGRAPGIGRLRRWCGRGERGGGYAPRQAALELVQAGTMDRTPQPIVADVGEPLGQHLRQKAANELQRWQGHGLPALVLGLLIAEADVTVRAREHPAIGQRNPVDIAPQRLQD